MAKITVLFTDGHEFSVENSDNAKEVINAYIEEYLDNNPNVSVSHEEFTGDKETPKLKDAKDAIVPESEDHYHEDDEYLGIKHGLFMGLLTFYKPEQLKEYFNRDVDSFTEQELYGTAKGMSKEELITHLNRFDLERSAYYIKHKLGVAFDTPISEVKEDELLNVLGHRNIVTSYNEVQRKWQAVIPLRDGIVIHLADQAVNAGLRGLITRLTGVYYVNNDALDTCVLHWMKVNGIKDDPRKPSEDYLNELAKACGTTLEELEADYQQAVSSGV